MGCGGVRWGGVRCGEVRWGSVYVCVVCGRQNTCEEGEGVASIVTHADKVQKLSTSHTATVPEVQAAFCLTGKVSLNPPPRKDRYEEEQPHGLPVPSPNIRYMLVQPARHPCSENRRLLVPNHRLPGAERKKKKHAFQNPRRCHPLSIYQQTQTILPLTLIPLMRTEM